MVHSRSGRGAVHGRVPDFYFRHMGMGANRPAVRAGRVVKYLCRCAAVFIAMWPLLLIGASIEGLQPWWAMVPLSAGAVWLANLAAKWGECDGSF